MLFMQFDSDPEAAARFCFHTAFNDPAVDPELPQRQSVEVRAIAFFPTPTARELGGRSLEDTVAHLHPGDSQKLRRMLCAGAARGIIHQKEIDDLVDQAAYTGANNDEYIATLCYERGKPYDPSMWHENAASKRIVEQLDREKAREREKFLNPPPPPHRLPDEDQDVGQLRRMFPKVNPDAVRALYRGFAGNFETTMEMLALALAEENGSVHHG